MVIIMSPEERRQLLDRFERLTAKVGAVEQGDLFDEAVSWCENVRVSSKYL